MWRATPVLLLLAVAAAGCDSDCDDPSRLNGRYATFSNISTPLDQVTGESVDSYPWKHVFINGWSVWELKYIPKNSSFQVYVDEQPYTASFTPDANNCNSFELKFKGTYTADDGSAHQFKWDGALAYFGTHIGGTFTWQDDWSGADGGSGSISIPEGEVTANLRTGENTDTGFKE